VNILKYLFTNHLGDIYSISLLLILHHLESKDVAKLIQNEALFPAHCQILLGNGSMILLWSERWTGDNNLHDRYPPEYLIVSQALVSRSRKLMLDLCVLWWVVILDLLGHVGEKSMLTTFDDIKYSFSRYQLIHHFKYMQAKLSRCLTTPLISVGINTWPTSHGKVLLGTKRIKHNNETVIAIQSLPWKTLHLPRYSLNANCSVQ
jgi:hypothetical protein